MFASTPNRRHRRRAPRARRALVCCSAFASAVWIATDAHGQSQHTWTGGGGDNNWSTTANWTNAIRPDGNDIIHFAGSTRLSNNNNLNTDGGSTFNSFRVFFDSGAGAFTLSGNLMKFFDFGGARAQIENDSTNLQTVNLRVGAGNLAGGLDIKPEAGDLLLNSSNSIFLDSNSELRFTGTTGKKATIASAIINGGGSTGAVAITDNTVVIFQKANTYTGETSVSAGRLQYDTGGSITSTIRLGPNNANAIDAAVDIIPAAGGMTVDDTINPRGTATTNTLSLNSQNTSGSNAYSGHIGLDHAFLITQSAGGTLNVTQVRATPTDTGSGVDIKGFTTTLQSAGNINVSGTIYNSTGNGNIVKTGGATVTYASGATQTYSGTTTVSAGTLTINGAHTGGGDYTISATGSIGGSGVVTLASSKSFTLSGNVSPGNSTGNLTLNGASNSSTTVFAGGGSYTWEINADANHGGSQGAATGWDLLTLDSVSVTATAGNKFAITVVGVNITNGSNWDPTSGEKHFKIADRQGATGFSAGDLAKFSLIVSGFDADENIGGFYLNVDGGGDLEIVYVPEPSSVVIGLFGASLLAARRRRRL